MVNRSKKAFTLLELIVVLVILGILAALAIPTFANVQQGAASRVASSTAKSIARDANAIAAANAAGSTTVANISTALSETTFASNVTAVWNSTSDAISITAGSATETCVVTIVGTVASVVSGSGNTVSC